MSSVPGQPVAGVALAIDSRIRTSSGWKTLDRVSIGEALASDDGISSVVTEVERREEEQVYRVLLSDRRAVECAASHPWTVHSDGWDGERLISTGEIARLLPQRMMWIDLPRGHFGHEDPLPLDPWMLGAVLADGAPTDPVPEEDAREDGGVAIAPASTRFNVLTAALARMGLAGVSREREFIPDVFMNSARRSRLAVLQGLLDTDGEISVEGEIGVSLVSELLAADVVELVRSVGGWCRSDREGREFRLHIGHANPRLLFRLSSKKNRFLSGCGDTARIAVVCVEATRISATRGLCVSHPSRHFMTNDYILTH
jgi:replicative DNA helicase